MGHRLLAALVTATIAAACGSDAASRPPATRRFDVTVSSHGWGGATAEVSLGG